MKRFYDWMMAKARSEHAPQALFWVSFIESSFFRSRPM